MTANAESDSVAKDLGYPAEHWIVTSYGVPEAFNVFWNWGGQRITVPVRPIECEKEIADALTVAERKRMAVLQSQYAGMQIKIPLARSFTVNYMWWVRGMSIGMIAVAHHVDISTVQRLVRRPVPRQMAPYALPAPGGSRALASASSNQVAKSGELIRAGDQLAKTGDLKTSADQLIKADRLVAVGGVGYDD